MSDRFSYTLEEIELLRVMERKRLFGDAFWFSSDDEYSMRRKSAESALVEDAVRTLMTGGVRPEESLDSQVP